MFRFLVAALPTFFALGPLSVGRAAPAVVEASVGSHAFIPPPTAPPSSSPTVDEAPAEPTPDWRFREKDRPIKVMVLAGSVGAFQKNSYADLIGAQCQQVEVKNLSHTGYGAYQLRKHFKTQVLENPRVNLRDDRFEYWLVFQGGLNSIAAPQRTNHHIRELFELAHHKGVKVVGLSVTPWGDESDKRRWAGLSGLEYRRYTQIVVDYVTGKASPKAALGSYVDRRDVPADAPWQPQEVADIGINLYDSALRDRHADARPIDDMRALLARDRSWQREHAKLSETQRDTALERDAKAASELPQWYMRPELRGFDHIHPNEQGHRALFDVMCPSLPASWACQCAAATRAGSRSP